MTHLAGNQSYEYDQQYLQVTIGVSLTVYHSGRGHATTACMRRPQEDRSMVVTMHVSMHGGARVMYPNAGPEPPALQVPHEAVETVPKPSAVGSRLRIHADRADHGRQWQQPPQATGTDLSQLSRIDTTI